MRPERFDPCIAVMPRSEMAKLIDLVKLSGMVVGSRRSTDGHDYWLEFREMKSKVET
jgi:hypothetical protein